MAGKIGDMFNKGIATISVKSESMVEISRNKTAIANAQKAFDEGIARLGQRLYADWKNGAVDLNTYAPEVEHIMQIERDIEGFKRRMEEIKVQENAILGQSNNKGSMFCSNCGKQLPPGSRFCDGCGTQVG